MYITYSKFEPFVVHYAGTVIIPAAEGKYRISPSDKSIGRRPTPLKAWLRGSAHD
ncbi:hypothetical protein [Erwinia typographi]|uniref:hypothetical protein n=1 Tax=Erwinia typographi TaxID=371042 RepID=UPI000A817322|nr:hypothetical protein [Erwinia typographi]